MLKEIRVDPSYVLRVSEIGAPSLNAAHVVKGQYVQLSKLEDGKEVVLELRNLEARDSKKITRDSSWSRRLEIRRLLLDELDQGSVENVNFPNVILQLAMALQLEAFDFPDQSSAIRAFHNNTHEVMRKKVFALLGMNESDYPTPVTDPHDPSYSHTDLFSTIYARQIKTVFGVVDKKLGEQATIVDLGGGFGHFSFLLAEVLNRRGLQNKFRLINIDASARDMGYGRERKWKEGAPIIFVEDDVTDPSFVNRLHRYEPDIIVSNHMLEHLPGTDVNYLKNRYLHDWLLAASDTLSISIPTNDPIDTSLSEHEHFFDETVVKDLAESMVQRVGFGAEAKDAQGLSAIGMMHFERTQKNFKACSILRPILPSNVANTNIHEGLMNPFDLKRFKKASLPVNIGEIADVDLFKQEGNVPKQVRQLLIKRPGSDDIHLPVEFAQFSETVKMIASHNKATNPWWDKGYGYLNVFRGMTNFDSYRGLSLNLHTDQMQSLRAVEGYMPDWSYIACSCIPTAFYPGPFDIDEAVKLAREGKNVNLYEFFNKQAEAMMEQRQMAEVNNVYLLSPYDLHSATDADRKMFRSFIKVAFSQKRFFDNRQLVGSPAFDNRHWYKQATVGYVDGYFNHAHWNERYLASDVPVIDPTIQVLETP
jgi:SAM-dependent methyltransferase